MSGENHYYKFYNAEDPNRWGRNEMPEQLALTRHWLLRAELQDPSKVILELGCGVGALSSVHPNYIGLDFSATALKKFVTSAPHVNGDMQCLPFKDISVDCIFSWAALEHVPHPEKALAEVERVLKGGGVAILAPAWNVRSWAAKGLPILSYRDLSWQDRLRKLTIPVRNSVIWRGLFAVPRRLWREIMALQKQSMPFDYKRLSPNLEEYIYTDCDAFTCMDAHAAVTYFKTRGWAILSHTGFLPRVLARHEPVVVRKPHGRRA
jgi:SAM-dependent methyltransferase